MAVRVALALAVLAAAPTPAAEPEVQARETEEKVKVAYVYQLPKFVEWPDELAKASTEPILLCLIGDDPLVARLAGLAGRDLKGRPLAVARLAVAGAPVACDLLFISRSEEPRLPLHLLRAEGARVLTVSDIPRFARRGGMIGLVTEDDRVRLEINLALVRQSGLRVSAKVLEIARVVP